MKQLIFAWITRIIIGISIIHVLHVHVIDARIFIHVPGNAEPRAQVLVNKFKGEQNYDYH